MQKNAGVAEVAQLGLQIERDSNSLQGKESLFFDSKALCIGSLPNNE